MISPLPIEVERPQPVAVPARAARSYWQEAWGRLRQNTIGMIAGGVLVFFVLVAIFAPQLAALLTHQDYRTIDLTNPFAAPLSPRQPSRCRCSSVEQSAWWPVSTAGSSTAC